MVGVSTYGWPFNGRLQSMENHVSLKSKTGVPVATERVVYWSQIMDFSYTQVRRITSVSIVSKDLVQWRISNAISEYTLGKRYVLGIVRFSSCCSCVVFMYKKVKSCH